MKISLAQWTNLGLDDPNLDHKKLVVESVENKKIQLFGIQLLRYNRSSCRHTNPLINLIHRAKSVMNRASGNTACQLSFYLLTWKDANKKWELCLFLSSYKFIKGHNHPCFKGSQEKYNRPVVQFLCLLKIFWDTCFSYFEWKKKYY